MFTLLRRGKNVSLSSERSRILMTALDRLRINGSIRRSDRLRTEQVKTVYTWKPSVEGKGKAYSQFIYKYIFHKIADMHWKLWKPHSFRSKERIIENSDSAHWFLTPEIGYGNSRRRRRKQIANILISTTCIGWTCK